MVKGEEKESEKEEEAEAEAEEESEEKEDSKEELEVILEEGDDKEIIPEEFEFEEEDILEDEECSHVGDSINPGVIEEVSNSNNDTISHEQEVADSWNKRYESLLNHK
jgi:hypothetical protein